MLSPYQQKLGEKKEKMRVIENRLLEHEGEESKNDNNDTEKTENRIIRN